MEVHELIEVLKKMPQNYEVLVNDCGNLSLLAEEPRILDEYKKILIR